MQEDTAAKKDRSGPEKPPSSDPQEKSVLLASSQEIAKEGRFYTGPVESSALPLFDKAQRNVQRIIFFAIAIGLPHLQQIENVENREQGRQEDENHVRGRVSVSREKDIFNGMNVRDTVYVFVELKVERRNVK